MITVILRPIMNPTGLIDDLNQMVKRQIGDRIVSLLSVLVKEMKCPINPEANQRIVVDMEYWLDDKPYYRYFGFCRIFKKEVQDKIEKTED